MKRMKHLMIGAALALVVAACGDDDDDDNASESTDPAGAPATAPTDSTASSSDPGAATTAAPATTPDSTEGDQPQEGMSVKVAKDKNVGEYLVDGDGRALYLFTTDQGTKTSCFDKCITAWPPIASENPTAGNGIDPTKLATSPDGIARNQLTYNGHLLYYFVTDLKPGQTEGALIPSWYLLNPQGDPIAVPGGPPLPGEGQPAAGEQQGEGAAVQVAEHPELGEHLVDGDGRTLYLFELDQGTTTACSGECAEAWPPVAADQPTAGDGVDQDELGTANGIVPNQVTYHGHLLYYFAADVEAGQIAGTEIDEWYAVDPDGAAIHLDGTESDENDEGGSSEDTSVGGY